MGKPRRRFTVVGDDVNEIKEACKKHFSLSHLNEIQPLSDPQEAFIQAYDASTPVILQVGSAGTGKTLLAAYTGLYDVIDKGTVYDKLIIARSCVPGRNIGFLKGTEEEKNMTYESPYVSLFDQLVKFKQKNYENLKAKGLVEFYNTSYLRGETWDNTIIVLDEMQNCSYQELSTIITRVGINSRLMMCGDFRQTDLDGNKSNQSGFHPFMKVIKEMPEAMHKVITYRPEHCVRSGIAREFLMAEERV